jgi:hypothetical protein
MPSRAYGVNVFLRIVYFGNGVSFCFTGNGYYLSISLYYLFSKSSLFLLIYTAGFMGQLFTGLTSVSAFFPTCLRFIFSFGLFHGFWLGRGWGRPARCGTQQGCGGSSQSSILIFTSVIFWHVFFTLWTLWFTTVQVETVGVSAAGC